MAQKKKPRPVKTRVLNRRIALLIVFLAVVESLLWFSRQGHVAITGEALKHINTFSVLVISLLSATVIIRLTEKRVFRLFKKEAEIEQRIFITKIYKYSIYAIAFMVVFSRLGLTMQSITIFLGFITTGVALALREILMSYFVWMIILIKKPFRIGDYIHFCDHAGTISRIGTFFITLTTDSRNENNFIKIPNKILLDKALENFGSDLHIKDSIKFPLTYAPEDIKDRMLTVQEKTNALNESTVLENWHLDMEKEGLRLHLSYQVPLEKKFLRQTEVISLVYDVLGEFIKK